MCHCQGPGLAKKPSLPGSYAVSESGPDLFQSQCLSGRPLKLRCHDDFFYFISLVVLIVRHFFDFVFVCLLVLCRFFLGLAWTR